MTEEEKQVIIKLREDVEYDKQHRLETIYDKKQIEFRNNIELMLNLIEKLNYKINLNELDRDYVNENFIEKDKIRDFIKRLEKDVENIREKKKDSHDYDRSSSRIQAYLTKTNEIIKRLKKLLEEG